MNNRKVINNSCYNSYLLFLCSPKEKKQKERAFAAVEKNPSSIARQRRRTMRAKRIASFRQLARVMDRIFFITPQVCDMTLTTREIQRLQQWQDATLSSEVPPCNLLFSFLCFVSFFFSGRRKKERNEGKNFYYHTNHLGSTAFVTDQNQNITQGFLYAPFGEITTEYDINFGYNVLPKYSFNAKELDEETGMYYYEARYYKPPVFTSRDAMFEKYFWMTPYAYCANNPLKYVDPDGREMAPIYDTEGNFLGTDDEGLTGKAIVMKKENFSQGMSHKDALSKSLGINGFVDKNAENKFRNHYNGLKNRPDYDGYLTKSEADAWWLGKSGQALYVDQSKIELPGITTQSFVDKENNSFYNNFLGSSSNTGSVYGTLKLTLIDANTGEVHIGGPNYMDKYDFLMDGRFFRDVATWVGRPGGANDGKNFLIYGYGHAKVPVVSPK